MKLIPWEKILKEYAMNYAVVDLGSNTIRLCVYQYDGEGIKTIINQKETAGLASYVVDGALQREGIERACEILHVYGMVMDNFVEPENARIIATASLRNIVNSGEAAAAIEQKTGKRVHVLSGEEEAMLDFVGASYRLSCENGLLIDIGGASTELVVFHNGRPELLTSMPIGSLSLYGRFVKGFFPNHRERKEIKKEVERHLTAIGWQTEGIPLMIGVGGTLKAAHKLSCALYGIPSERKELSACDIKALNAYFKEPDDMLFHTVYKTVPERALTIVPGLILLYQAIRRFGCTAIRISEYGVREGYLLERVIKPE
ncbi:MAG TPA: phosphatase [Clostridia bacterium]|nr:phosphatase [Clostridia bacterium]